MPPLNEDQITALTEAVDRCHAQAIEQDRHPSVEAGPEEGGCQNGRERLPNLHRGTPDFLYFQLAKFRFYSPANDLASCSYVA
jgi:hypothetical protein